MTPGARRFAPTPLPPALRGRWIAVRTAVGPGLAAAFVEPLDADGRALAEPVAAWRWPGGGLAAVLFAGDAVAALGLVGMGALPDEAPAAGAGAPLAVRPIGSWHAAARVFVRRPTALAAALGRGDGARGQLKARIRAAQATLLAPRGRKLPYVRWLALWGAEALGARTDPPVPEAAIRGALLWSATGTGPALAATRAALRRAGLPVGLVSGPADWRMVARGFGGGDDDYFVLLQAGEIPERRLRTAAGRALAAAGLPPLAITDIDRIDRTGRRTAPEFRGAPDPALMLSGMTARGAWLVRHDVLMGFADRCGAEAPARWAEALRLALWCAERERERDGVAATLPIVLSSRRDDAEAAPATALAPIVDAHLEQRGIGLRAAPGGWPIRLHPRPGAPCPSVTAIIPSTLAGAPGTRAIDAIMRGTDWPALDAIVAIGGGAAGDDLGDAARQLEASHATLRVRRYPAPEFNFAWTVNRALAEARGEFVLLLNDDVSPINRDWLRRMAAWLGDRRVGAVGARLVYPDGAIQHAGVVMGGADLCAHAFRGQPGDAPGHGGRAMLPSCWSALTGACLLLRTAELRALGGLDEHYPSAFNDIDLCLRIGERGGAVVLSDATLVHEELQTYGSHWNELGVAQRDRAVARMRERWPGVIEADPCFSPNLDLDALGDWHEAWPPRGYGLVRGSAPQPRQALGAWTAVS